MKHVLILALGLAVLCACGRDGAREARDAEALRMRVERLEQEAAEDRAKAAADLSALREEVSALRTSLDEASRHVAALSGQEAGTDPENGAKPTKPQKQQKSPRAALKESLSGALESSKQAVRRLGRQLDKALAPKPARPEKPAEAPSAAPAAPGQPE